MQRSARPGKQLGAPRQVDAVVGLATVEGAADFPHETGLPQLAQVVGDQALRLAHQGPQLPDPAVAARQLPQQLPPQRVPDKPQDRRRALDGANGNHVGSIDQTRLI